MKQNDDGRKKTELGLVVVLHTIDELTYKAKKRLRRQRKTNRTRRR